MRGTATQHHFIAQAIHSQRLMHFGNADFCGAAGVFQTGYRRRAGAAGVAGDIDDIGAGLGHADSDGADTFRRYQFDYDFDPRRLGVVNQLTQVLDRIGVMMRRRANQLDFRRATAQGGDFHGHFRRRQLTALAGLGALGDFDFDFLDIGVGQITRPNAEPAGSELLDLAGS